MQKVLTAEQIREVDRLTTERYGIPSILLMENAAHAVARVITEKLGGSVKGKSILILCGKGNNGGDGAALGWKLALAGAGVEIVLFGKAADTKGDARLNFDAASREVDWLREIESVDAWDEWFYNSWQDWDLVVDAIFGTGLDRPLAIWLGNVIRYMNIANEAPLQIPRTTLSVDLPSGLNSNTGELIGECFQADFTVTFTCPKPANVIAPASSFGGELLVEDIGSPYELVSEFESQLFVTEPADIYSWLDDTKFSHDSYKNKRGHALVIAGSEDYSGAAVLAGNAAMRSGVGLVTLAVPAAIRSEVAARAVPDLIVRPFDEGGEFDLAADAILIGCGLDGNNNANEAMFRRLVVERTTPVIVDAGALSYLNPERGENHRVGDTPPSLLGKDGSPRELILTPHEGEFMRLLGTTDKEFIKERVAAVRDFATTNNVILVLKGERVLIGASDGRVVVNPTGNSGLGKAGNGDTLAGILVGFVAQAVKFEIDIFETVAAAVYIAGVAGDIAEKKYGKRVMTASDVRECLAEAVAAVGEEK